MKGYIKADFAGDMFPLLPGDKFLATDKRRRTYHYQYCGNEAPNSFGDFTVYNEDINDYSNVEHEWFRQRKITLNPFNRYLKPASREPL